MKCLLYNKNQPFLTLDIVVDIPGCIVKNYHFLSDNIPEDFLYIKRYPKEAKELLSVILSRRISSYITSLSDEEVLDFLLLKDQAHLFGRMQEYLFLVAFLSHLKMESDNISLYPQKTEFLSFVDQDPRFTQVYKIEPKCDFF